MFAEPELFGSALSNPLAPPMPPTLADGGGDVDAFVREPPPVPRLPSETAVGDVAGSLDPVPSSTDFKAAPPVSAAS